MYVRTYVCICFIVALCLFGCRRASVTNDTALIISVPLFYDQYCSNLDLRSTWSLLGMATSIIHGTWQYFIPIIDCIPKVLIVIASGN